MQANAAADMLEAASKVDAAAESFSNSVACLGEFLGMDAENRQRDRNGLAPAYTALEFQQVAERHGLLK